MTPDFLTPAPESYQLTSASAGPVGLLPLSEDQLRHAPSGDLFGWSQNVGMGLDPARLGRPEYLILSTAGGLRAPDGSPIALGYHTGHWEVALQVQAAAEEIRAAGCIPFAGAVTDPCDGRTQGTPGMFDSLPFRNDAAMVLRRLIRSLPTRAGVLGIATCDKGLPAMMMALAGCGDRPAVLVPGGVMLAGTDQEDTAKVQTIGARYAAGRLTLEEAAEQGCRTCASPGGGCQFLGTAATSQVVAEALGLTLPHAALAPSGQPVWLDLARRSARALMSAGAPLCEVLSPDSVENAMVVHAAFGGSTNLLIHIPAVAVAAGLPRPTVDDWTRVNRAVPRLVDALPNGPIGHPTVRVFLAGGVPEVMLHLRDLGLLKLTARTVTGQSLEQVLAWWERSEPRKKFRELLASRDGIDPDDVILPPTRARERGLTPTACFPTGNLAPEGSVIKATAIDPAVVDADGVYRHEGPARVFTREADAVAAIKTGRVVAGDVLVLAGGGPLGTGMEETYQVTSALRYLPWGRHVAVLTDARFSGVSTGACIGHISPEALAGGPLGRLRDGDRVRIVIDRLKLVGSVDYVGGDELSQRSPHPGLAPDPRLPADTRLWAALQNASGGVWAGCVYDPDRIAERLAVFAPT
ncbi:MAG: YjhG/YagF family D-xylonate dehydratase [Gemmataceae bacterium]|nr:YjhG/YagF family D-xylonate dehydratase [Gemmataceae bacterium]